MALASPHRVVSVHDERATNWTHYDDCAGSGPCSEYYGDDAFVNQAVVDGMVATGLMMLTDADTVTAAWRAILPNYRTGEIIAVKVNFNDSIMGGGTSGYGDNDAYVDALPQIINSMVAGLVQIGVRPEDVWVYDASRYITDRFRAGIAWEDIQYFDRYGNGEDGGARESKYELADPTARIDFTESGYDGTSHRVPDLLLSATYLINIPIMKRHGGAGITLALKNHLGSINGFYSGGHTMHDAIYLNSADYRSDANPMVGINDNPNIRDKTVLIVGDALYGGWRSNNTPPERWSSFGNDSPNMLFFAGDPVAVDSVMFDYLDREGYVNPRAEDILILAAERGLGLHERWDSDTSRQYAAIDYIEIEGADTGPTDPDPPDADPPDVDSNGGGGSSGGCFVDVLWRQK